MADTQPIRITFSTLFLIILIIAVVILAIAKPLYIVEEGEQVVVTRFGQIIAVETAAGLKVKAPFIDKVTKYSRKILSWDGEPNRIPTFEKQFIWVDPTARWKITDPQKFYSTINTMEQAFSRLDDLIDSAVRTTISQNKLVEAVRNTNHIITFQDKLDEALLPESANADTSEDSEDGLSELTSLVSQREAQPLIEKGRRQLTEEMLTAVKTAAPIFGIEIIDIVIRQIRYSDDLTESIYNRMISERKQKAQVYRSFGEGRKQQWLGQLENEKKTILSKAYAESEEIKGEADAEAAGIYATAYSQNVSFFRFWRSMESYKKTVPYVDKVLSTDIDYFDYLYSSTGQ